MSESRTKGRLFCRFNIIATHIMSFMDWIIVTDVLIINSLLNIFFLYDKNEYSIFCYEVKCNGQISVNVFISVRWLHFYINFREFWKLPVIYSLSPSTVASGTETALVALDNDLSRKINRGSASLPIFIFFQ